MSVNVPEAQTQHNANEKTRHNFFLTRRLLKDQVNIIDISKSFDTSMRKIMTGTLLLLNEF